MWNSPNFALMRHPEFALTSLPRPFPGFPFPDFPLLLFPSRKTSSFDDPTIEQKSKAEGATNWRFPHSAVARKRYNPPTVAA